MTLHDFVSVLLPDGIGLAGSLIHLRADGVLLVIVIGQCGQIPCWLDFTAIAPQTGGQFVTLFAKGAHDVVMSDDWNKVERKGGLFASDPP
jgi:hypothetical protein